MGLTITVADHFPRHIYHDHPRSSEPKQRLAQTSRALRMKKELIPALFDELRDDDRNHAIRMFDLHRADEIEERSLHASVRRMQLLELGRFQPGGGCRSYDLFRPFALELRRRVFARIELVIHMQR